MPPSDLCSNVVSALAGIASELLETISDVDGQKLFLRRVGLAPPDAAPPVRDDALAATLATLRDAPGTLDSSFQVLKAFNDASVALASLVQQAASLHSPEDAWNLLADWFALVSVDRLRRNNPAAVGLLSALHLLSDDRLLIRDLFASMDHWGSFVLGTPRDEDTEADNLALVVGAVVAIAGFIIPEQDARGLLWRPRMLFGWDPEPDSAAPRAQRALQRMATMRLERSAPGAADTEKPGFTAVVVPPTLGGLGVLFGINFGEGLTFPIREHLSLELSANTPALQAFFAKKNQFVDADKDDASAKIVLQRKAEAADYISVFPEGGVHFELGTFVTGLDFGRATRLHFRISDGALVLPKKEFGFMGNFMPDAGIKFPFDVELQIDRALHPSFAGGAGMNVTLPVNRSISALRVKAVTLGLAIGAHDGEPAAELRATVAFGLNIGALVVSVGDIGARLTWTLPSPRGSGAGQPGTGRNLGPAGNIEIGPVPPRAIGISLHTSGAHGGGQLFFDPERQAYGGVLEIVLRTPGTAHTPQREFQAKAAGLLRERDADWDLIVFLTLEFAPGFQLAPGILLTGAGVIVGVNVAVDGDRLRASVRDGSLARLMFPQDPLSNAPAIIETMGGVFPYSKDDWVLGLMLRAAIGGPLATLALGAAIVTRAITARPSALIVFGKLRLAAPSASEAALNLEADFAADIDFKTSSFSFDAALVHSRFASFPLTGDVVLRTGAAGFVLAAGGLHPCFHPRVPLPKLKRLALDMSEGSFLKIRAEAYYALTSNTLQMGQKMMLDISAPGAKLHGALNFDGLLQWQPRFCFSIQCGASLELRVRGRCLAGVSVDLLLEGPAPWHAKGRASVHIFFFTVHVNFDHTWGNRGEQAHEELADPLQEVALACAEDSAWLPVAPAGDSWFSLRRNDAVRLRLHPFGTLRVSQNVAPFGVRLSRVGARKAGGGPVTLQVTPTQAVAWTPSQGQFAMSQFLDLSDKDKLARPSFEPCQDGIVFGAGQPVASQAVACKAVVETLFVRAARRQDPAPLDAFLFEQALQYGQVARSGLHAPQLDDGPDQRVVVTTPRWRVASGASLRPVLEQDFESFTVARQAADFLTGVADAQVVGAHELSL